MKTVLLGSLLSLFTFSAVGATPSTSPSRNAEIKSGQKMAKKSTAPKKKAPKKQKSM